MVEMLLAEAKKAKRPVYAHGIDGLQPGIATDFNPQQWNAFVINERDGQCHCDASKIRDRDGNVLEHPRHDHTQVADGALVFVDEAWKFFGHLHDASRAPTPKHVLDLAEHRHRGIDFVWTTQTPGQIYPFARGMCNDHHHVVRRFGTSIIDVFTWSELNEDVKSAAKRDASLRETRVLPSEAWKAYKSASVHTIKRKLPMKLILLPVVLVAAAVLLWFAVNALRPKNMADRINGKNPDGAAVVSDAASGAAAGPAVDPFSPQGLKLYADRLRPRFPTMPESAPIYDDRPAVSVPQVFCMASAPGQAADGWKEASVSCFTEQGTRYSLPTTEARTLARYGRPYDAFKEPAQPLASQTVTGPSGAAPVGTLGLGWSSGAIPAGTGTP